MNKLLATLMILVSLLLISDRSRAEIDIVTKKDGEPKNDISIVKPKPSAPARDDGTAEQSTSSTSDVVELKSLADNPATNDSPANKAAANSAASRVQADSTQDQAMIVLDASGSMWGKINDNTKITIARNVVGDVLGIWGETTDLGLVSYGHRQKGDCSDIETLIKPATLDRSQFAEVVGTLQPKGKTPLTQAVIHAAEELKYTENRATVILISDGEETCNLDPCEAGESLQQLGIDFTAHVVSFDVAEEKVAGLRCLADTTGGQFLQANDAQELKDALQKAVVVTTDRAVVDESPATVRVPESVIAGAHFDAHWSGPKNKSDRLVVLNETRTKTLRSVYIGRDDDKSPAEMQAPETPGQYVVQYRTRGYTSLGEALLQVTPAAATIAGADSVVAGSIFDVHWTGPKNKLDRVAILSTDGKKTFGYTYIYRDQKKSPAEIRAPETVGDYSLVYQTRGKNVLARTPLRVVAAQASVSAPETVVAGATFDAAWTGPKNKSDRLRIFSLNGKKAYHYRYIYRDNAKSPAELQAPEVPGDYLLHYYTHGKNSLASTPFTVVAATANLSVPATVVAGSTFDVIWTGPKNKLDKLVIFSANGKKKYDTARLYQGRAQSPTELTAPEQPGRYAVHYYTKGRNTLARAEFTVVGSNATIE